MPDEAASKKIDLLARLMLSATPVFGGPLEIIYSEVAARRRARGAETIEMIVGGTGPEVLLQRLSDDPLVERVFVSAVDAAIRTGLDAKRRLLARAATTAIIDDARVNESYLIVTALEELDVPHILALRRLSDEWDATLARVEADPEAGSLGDSPAFAMELEPIRAALVRTGTAKPSAGNLFTAESGARRVEGISDFGLLLLSQLREEGLTD